MGSTVAARIINFFLLSGQSFNFNLTTVDSFLDLNYSPDRLHSSLLQFFSRHFPGETHRYIWSGHGNFILLIQSTLNHQRQHHHHQFNFCWNFQDSQLHIMQVIHKLVLGVQGCLCLISFSWSIASWKTKTMVISYKLEISLHPGHLSFMSTGWRYSWRLIIGKAVFLARGSSSHRLHRCFLHL